MDGWLSLYHALPNVENFRGTSEETFVFSRKPGLPVKVGSTKRHLLKIPYDEKYFMFFQENPVWFMLPVALPGGKIIGFLLRPFHHKAGPKYILISATHKQLVFGLENFSDYTKDSPIILVEGSKDQIVVGSCYPFTLALLGTRISPPLLDLIATMTDKVVLALDNDEQGYKATGKLSKAIENRGIKVKIITPVEKDWGNQGEYIGTKILKDQIDYQN